MGSLPKGDYQPPVATTKDYCHVHHGTKRSDPYYWLRDKANNEVIDYLKEENKYTDSIMAETGPLQKALFGEIKARIKQDDSTYPVRWKNYYYYTQYDSGSDYARYYRKHVDSDGPQGELTFDVPQMASGQDYFDFDEGDVSPDESLIIFSTDITGRGLRTLRIKDLNSGEILDDTITNVEGGHAWAADNKTFFYTKQDPQTLRDHQIWRHHLGHPVEDDVLIYEEQDETFGCYVFSSRSEKFIIIGSSQTLCDEYRLLSTMDPEGDFKLFQARSRGLEYDLEHYGDRFYLRTNYEAPNFRLMWVPEPYTTINNWRDLIAEREGVYLNDFEVFENYLVTEERENGLVKIRIHETSNEENHEIEFDEPAYSAWIDTNLDPETEWLRYGYSSFKDPETLYEYNLRSREKRLLKSEQVLGGYDSDLYTTERHFVTVRDGARVPVSIVYRNDSFKKDGTSPLLLYAYGAYGYNSDVSFRSSRLSLLDRGFVYVIAHIRGGQELGRDWYDAGRLLNKKNSFNDFIDCAEFFVKEKYTSSDLLCASGASAGGLLMGVVANQKPKLFAAIIADVPWVDCVTTMLDPKVPLTTSEYDEWGNPEDNEVFNYILSYSPYDNVKHTEYPAMLVLAGLNDSQVQFWEPTKWVALLRSKNIGNEPLLLKTNMESGHSGSSGRYEKYKEIAFEYAFLLRVVGY
jgi:oligopeptidase B